MHPTPNPQHQTPNLVECPRDAMQGWASFIPTDQKISYLNTLLQVGFHTLDFGSFVSPKAIPQMADTKEVLTGLDLSNTKTKLLAIAANQRGAEEAVAFEQISYLGFPFSLSPTFQQRNTNSTIEEAVQRVDAIQELCLQHNKELVLYLSMGFGNPYGDAYNEEVLLHWAEVMAAKGIAGTFYEVRGLVLGVWCWVHKEQKLNIYRVNLHNLFSNTYWKHESTCK